MAPEPSRGAGLVAALGVLVALGAAVSLTEFFVAPGYRQTAIRLISALVLLVALARVRPIVAAAVERRVAWGDEILDGWADRRAADSRLARLRDEIRFSVRSQSYFEHLLWPRLVALARARGGSPEAEKPSGRRFGRGPSVTALARLIGSLETRR
ncbi:MAG: hypothetical protein DMD87_09140 [Candidatus Rokuibacteriota bacterium]|nr:MAG: hypothetical protein DMD87_09140 [Candidatus Rokubacteria bacterium]